MICAKVHENPSYDSEDTELKVIYFPRNVPFITVQSQAKITTINTHACTVCDMNFHENRSSARRATDLNFALHVKCRSLLTDRNQSYNN